MLKVNSKAFTVVSQVITLIKIKRQTFYKFLPNICYHHLI